MARWLQVARAIPQHVKEQVCLEREFQEQQNQQLCNKRKFEAMKRTAKKANEFFHQLTNPSNIQQVNSSTIISSKNEFVFMHAVFVKKIQ